MGAVHPQRATHAKVSGAARTGVVGSSRENRETMMRTFALSAALALAAAAPALADGGLAERGKYLVERVGMCADCHTPRDEKGMPIAARELDGAPIGFRPLAPMPFAEYAPRLAGIPPTYTEAEFVAFLESGKRPDGSSPRPPMPEYRLAHEDALAVAAYLKALP
jgi:mono/diheme cytochrome c family protein